MIVNAPVKTLTFTEFLLSVVSITSPLAITLLPSVYSKIAPLVKVAFVLRTIFKDTVDESNKPVSSNVPPTIFLSTINLPSSTSPTAIPETPVDG